MAGRGRESDEAARQKKEFRRCLAIDGYRCLRDPRLSYIHSRWVDEAAFDTHARLVHTTRFVERVQPLIAHPLDVARTMPIN